MRSNVPEKLVKIAREIEESGSASLTRLTVLKKWFEHDPKRLASFAIFIANRAASRTGRAEGEAVLLLRDARLLLKGAKKYNPQISREAAGSLYCSLKDFQNEYQKQFWGPVRIIRYMDLFLIEDGLRIYLHANSPSDGYRLAATYCENYDSKYGNCLNGPSFTRINEIVRFMISLEVLEDAGG
jgi:hypothetical protein